MKTGFRKINCLCLVLAILLGMTVEIKYLTNVSIPSWLIKSLILAFCLLGMLIERDARMTKQDGAAFVLILVFLSVFALATRYNIMNYFDSFVLFVLVFFLYNLMLQRNGGWNCMMDSYSDVMIVIGLITMFFWLFGSVLDILPGRTTVRYYWDGNVRTAYTYFYLYFENPIQNQKLLGMSFARNCGIFTEAPAFSGALLYAFGIEMFGRERIRYGRLGVLIAAILTAQSTKGLLILIIMLGLYYVFENNKNRSGRYIAFKLLTSIALIAGSALLVWIILEDKSGTGSYAARTNHLISGFKTWLQHPIFGAGYNNRYAIIDNQEAGSGHGGLSMGLTLLLANGGLYLLAFYFGAFFFALRNPQLRMRKKNFTYYALLLLLNLIISNSAFTYPYRFMLGAAYACGMQTEITRTEKALEGASGRPRVQIKLKRPERLL